MNIAKPGIQRGSTIFDRSNLKSDVYSGAWLKPDILDHTIAKIAVRQYFMGDCAFPFIENIIKIEVQRLLHRDSGYFAVSAIRRVDVAA